MTTSIKHPAVMHAKDTIGADLVALNADDVPVLFAQVKARQTNGNVEQFLGKNQSWAKR